MNPLSHADAQAVPAARLVAPAASADTAGGDASAVAAPPPKPRRRSVIRHVAHFIALGGGSGLSPVAPGTVGTLWAWLTYFCLSLWLHPSAWAWVIGVGTAVGWWACTVTARDAGKADPGFIVWDEVLAFWLVLWVIEPSGWGMQLAAFGLFRFFDAVKPGPVGWADQHFKGAGWRGGFGILFDDLVAAGCTLLTLALAVRLMERFSGT